MASIRRAQSPFPNGGSPFTNESPSQKQLLITTSASSSSSSSLWSLITKLLGSLFTKPHRKIIFWKRALYRCLVFFFLGFLLGMVHFNDLSNRQDTQFNRISFENDMSKGVTTANDVDVFTKIERLSAVETTNIDEGQINLRKQLIVVTPTYNRALQSYYLTRLGYVLRLVNPPLLWIVVEMSAASLETADLLRNTGVMYRHLVCEKNLTDVKDRGVHQRNRALEHIELHRLDGIVYFADDDNIYTLELFESLRKISRFGTWPVAMLAQSKNKAVLEGPVCNGSQVVGWHTNEKSKRLRRFHIDMSGFGFNSTILWDPKRWRRPTSNPVRQLDTVKEGFQETTFIEQLVEDENQMEGIPHGCSKIMNWHLHLESRELDYPKGWVLQKNLDIILPTK